MQIGDGTNGPAKVTPTPGNGTSFTGLNALNVLAFQMCSNGTTADLCTQIGTGTPGTPNLTTVLSVQGEASMTPLAGNITQVLGTAISATNPLFSSITDGTNKAAVKAASTAPVATDPALVVALSPNGINANGQATMANSAPVAIASNQSAVPTSLNATPSLANGNGVVPTQGGAVLSITNPSFAQVSGGYFNNVTSSTLTRPADTTAYAANETVCLLKSVTVCAPITISIATVNAGKGLINRISLLKSGSSITNASFTIWFFSAAPGTATPSQFDSTSYTGPRAADMPNYIGNAVCTNPVVTSDTSTQVWYDCVLSNPNTGGALDFQALSGATTIDALISVTAAYTPASAETFKVYASGIY